MPYVYVQSPQQVRSNGIAIAALITGLIGLVMTVVTGWIPIVGFFLILLPTMLAIIFGLVGRAQARRGAPHAGTATAGLTCGVVGLLLATAMQLCWGVLIGGFVMSASEVDDEMPAAAEELQQVQQEIQQHLQAEWTRMKEGYPELEIEIDETDPKSNLTPTPSQSTSADSGTPDDTQSRGADRVPDERREEGDRGTAEPPII